MLTSKQQRSNEKIFLSTVDCYDAWSKTYDDDGNILQLLDDAAFEEFVRPLLNEKKNSIRWLCELGCGTGRNTEKLLKTNCNVIAVDVSKGMMRKAQQRLASLINETTTTTTITWLIHDLNTDEKLDVNDSSIDAVLSTLVIEHIVSLDRYFQTIFRLLKKTNESWVWISAMHPNMYRAGSQASFVSNSTTGEKSCGVSFDHSIDEIIQSAKRNQLRLIRCVEKSVENAEHAQNLGRRATKWIGIPIHLSFLFQIDRDQ